MTHPQSESFLRSYSTPYGRVHVAPVEDLFRALTHRLAALAATAENPLRIGLAGGSTPQALFRWWSQNFPPALLKPLREWGHFMVSDERMVPLESEESNFGNAQRLLLDPLKFTHRYPWPVGLPPTEAAKEFSESFQARYPGRSLGFDFCCLGLGEDGHTASWFPNCPWLDQPAQPPAFDATYWPQRGWRLSLTPYGLLQSGQIILLACGAGKAATVKAVLEGVYQPTQLPAQALRAVADRVSWWIDPPAAAHLTGLSPLE